MTLHRALKIDLDLENDAFDGTMSEAARILRKLADQLEEGVSPDEPTRLYDINGNHVGDAAIVRRR